MLQNKLKRTLILRLPIRVLFFFVFFFFFFIISIVPPPLFIEFLASPTMASQGGKIRGTLGEGKNPRFSGLGLVTAPVSSDKESPLLWTLNAGFFFFFSFFFFFLFSFFFFFLFSFSFPFFLSFFLFFLIFPFLFLLS